MTNITIEILRAFLPIEWGNHYLLLSYNTIKCPKALHIATLFHAYRFGISWESQPELRLH